MGNTNRLQVHKTVYPPMEVETGEGVTVHSPAEAIDVSNYRASHPSTALIYTDEWWEGDRLMGMLLYEGPVKEISIVHDSLNKIGDRPYICVMPDDWMEQMGVYLNPTEDLEHTYNFERSGSRMEDISEYSIPIGLTDDFSMLNWVRIFGSLQALYGEPDYLTEDFENMYQYSLLATRSDGVQFVILVYSGPTGPSISCEKPYNSMKAGAAFALRQLLEETQPADYSYEGYYLDGPTKLEFGIKDGEPYFREQELGEEDRGI